MKKRLEEAVTLLSRLISAPSVSRDEALTAGILEEWLAERGCAPVRIHNNIIVLPQHYDPQRPTLLLNSHHDTVKPSPAYTRDPFKPEIIDGRLYGLGSNDAGASLTAIASAFLAHRSASGRYNLVLALTAEEEVGGEHGIRSVLPWLEEQGYRINMALVGEPTSLQPAIGERGLVVLDCTAKGKTGHAARNEGINALYKAIDDINTLRRYNFPKKSAILGEIKVSVTQIEAGRQHNVVPEECRFVVDVRTTDAYTNQETADILDSLVESECKPRSTRVWASVIDKTHPLVKVAVSLEGKPFVSPTTSDMSQLHNIPSLKVGPGESSRSHTADEYVTIDELAEGIEYYDKFLTKFNEQI